MPTSVPRVSGAGRGDSAEARAYLLLKAHLHLLTEDHNARRAYEGCGDPSLITACLGGVRSGQDTERIRGHPAIEFLRGPARPGRPLLVSDGAYLPHENVGHDLASYLIAGPRTAAAHIVVDAVRCARELSGPYADDATALVAHLTGGGGEPGSPCRCGARGRAALLVSEGLHVLLKL
ncbi:hypothetical protein E6P78_12045 [Streptomyces sp. A0958]|uniref:hypothetical protein n=1 Tax=Streptomyces sp. A0958 TaxID=2563101 RepID=UPI00109E51EB|nr:hypothetical protein [Streptomyces sp. A0958]THA70128.1 hypothetical protein E6P78_12045 [Streptomyces sp. A0958]